jgi:hypothetical protein
MGHGKRLHALLNYRSILGWVIGPAKAHDTVDNRENVFGAVVDFHEKAMFRRFQCLDLAELRDVDLSREEVGGVAVVIVDGSEVELVPKA